MDFFNIHQDIRLEETMDKPSGTDPPVALAPCIHPRNRQGEWWEDRAERVEGYKRRVEQGEVLFE
jgi:hypothetical protein